MGLLYSVSEAPLHGECGAQAEDETYRSRSDSVFRGLLVGGRSILVVRVLVDDMLIGHRSTCAGLLVGHDYWQI